MNKLRVSLRNIIAVCAVVALAVVAGCSAGAGASVGY
jgi:hypothetical protein